MFLSRRLTAQQHSGNQGAYDSGRPDGHDGRQHASLLKAHSGATFDDVGQWRGLQAGRRPLKDLSGHIQDTVGTLALRVLPNWHRIIGPLSSLFSRVGSKVLPQGKLGSRRPWHGLLE